MTPDVTDSAQGPRLGVVDLDFTPWVDHPTTGDPDLVHEWLAGTVSADDLKVLVELDEGIWWSTTTEPPMAESATDVPTDNGRGLDEVVAMIRRAARSTYDAGSYPLLVAHLRAVCLRAWELTWDHSALLAVLAACAEPAGGTDRLHGDCPSPRSTIAVGSPEWLAQQLIELTRIDLRLETACSTTSFTAVAATCHAGVRTGDVVADQLADQPGTGFSEFVTITVARRRSYYAAVGRAADAALSALIGEGDDLDEAIAQLGQAEIDQDDDEFCRAELRAHRVSLEALAAARERSWLWVDAGKVTIIYPFGLRGAPFSTVVTTVRHRASNWSLGGVELANQPTQLLLVDDVWRGEDPLQRRYEGTQLDLPPIHVQYSEAGAAAARSKGAMTEFLLEPALVLSRLGNHHLRIEIEIEDAGPHTLAYVAWLGAPEFGDLTELDSSIQLTGSSRSWGRLSDLVDDVLSDLATQLQADGLSVTLSARAGMSHVITTIYRASALPGGRRADAVPLTHAAHLYPLFGSQVLFHPVPSGVAALASWTLYQHQGQWIATSALVEEQLVMSGNHTLLASFHAPLFMVETVAEAVEFVVSLDGLFSAWQDDLADFYGRLRDDIDSFSQQLMSPNPSARSLTETTRTPDSRETEPIAKPATDTGSIEEHLAVVDQLEREQIRLRQFTTRARVSLLFVASPALVASPVMRHTIDDLLQTRPSWRGRHEFTQTAEQVLGDRLTQLIGSLTRRREAQVEAVRALEHTEAQQREERDRERDDLVRQEAARRQRVQFDREQRGREAEEERQGKEATRRNVLAQTVVTAIAAVGVSGVVAIVQSGLELKGPTTVLLAIGVIVLSFGFGLGFWILMRDRKKKVSPVLKVQQASAEQVQEIHRAVLQPAFPATELESADALTSRVRAGTAQLWQVADQEGVPVGAAVTERLSPSEAVLLTYFAVRADRRGGGIGGRMLESVVSAAVQLHRPTMILAEVEHPDLHDNHPSYGDPGARLRFYGQHGAKVLDAAYFQPSIGPGLAPVYGMLLLTLWVRPDLQREGRLTSSSSVATALSVLMPEEGLDRDHDLQPVRDIITRAAGADGVALFAIDDYPRVAVVRSPAHRDTGAARRAGPD